MSYDCLSFILKTGIIPYCQPVFMLQKRYLGFVLLKERVLLHLIIIDKMALSSTSIFIEKYFLHRTQLPPSMTQHISMICCQIDGVI